MAYIDLKQKFQKKVLLQKEKSFHYLLFYAFNKESETQSKKYRLFFFLLDTCSQDSIGLNLFFP